MGDLGQALAGLGGLFVGIAAVWALFAARTAKHDAHEARKTSPPAVIEGLRKQVQALVDTHEETLQRHANEVDGLEQALKRERARADGCELIALRLQATIAEMQLDLAAARSEVNSLRTRFEASVLASSERQTLKAIQESQ